MITFEYTNVAGWEHAIRGMRNPLESWAKSDSTFDFDSLLELGPNDLGLMKRLRKAGTDHRKFMRMITVYVDITAPLYWWKEFDTYKVGTVANSCSTMHYIHKHVFSYDDFSCEQLLDEPIINQDGQIVSSQASLNLTIDILNVYREKFIDTKDKKYWWQMIQLLPSSYNQKRTVMLNYEVLANMYKSRKDHKLDEWYEFCDWIRELPYSELILGESSEKNDTSVEAQEEHSLPSMDEINKLFNEVMRVDGRIRSYRVFDKFGMKILDFYDANHKSLYAVDLYCTTLDEVLAGIKEEIVKLTRQNLGLGA